MSFKKYFDMGLSVMPVRGKMPLLAWKKWQTLRATPEQVEAWEAGPHNVGIITGHVSGILVVDVDGETDLEFPETWTVKTAKGYHYYFNLPEGMDLRNRARAFPNVDIRAEGGYVVAPPSVHASGHIYAWTRPPEETTLADIPEWLFLPVSAPPVRAPVQRVSVEPESSAYVQAAIDGELSALSMAVEGTRNDQLNKSAFALAGLLPAGKVCDLLRPVALSIGLGAIETDKTLQSAIRSAAPRDIPDVEYPPQSGQDCPLVRAILERNGRKVEHSEIAPDLIDEAPGLVGHLVKWILETSLYPQPILALAASLPAIGVVMAHKVATETNLRTNFYTLGIAESGAGKEHARRCISRLFAQTNLADASLGDPASAVAVINAIKRAGGRGLMMIDEFGRFLESMKGRNAASHVKMITTNFMYLYNAAGDTFTGQEYANNDMAGGRSDIVNPCLGVYATSVPSRFYGALSAEDAFDGFLSRWLVFETTRFDLDPVMGRSIGEAPAILTDEIMWWNQQSTRTLTGYDPRVIPFKNPALYYAYIRDCRAKMRDAKTPVEKAFWNRGAEHAAKLALVAHVGENIDDATLDWAITLTNAQTQAMINNIMSNLAENSYEADLKRVLRAIEPGGMSKNEITRKTQWLDRRRRQDILDNLIESGMIHAERVEGEGRASTVYSPAS